MAELGELVGTDKQEDSTSEEMGGLAGFVRGQY